MTLVRDLAILWDAFWGYDILSKDMVELFVEPCGTGSAHLYYGHGIWIYDEDGRFLKTVRPEWSYSGRGGTISSKGVFKAMKKLGLPLPDKK